MKFTRRTGAAPLGLALVVTSANALPVQAADNEQVLSAYVPPVTMAGPGSPGKAVPMYLEEQNVVNPTVTLDLAGLAGVATVKLPGDCTTAGTVLTCTLPTANTWQSIIPMLFQAAPGSAKGSTGTFTFTTKADNYPEATSTAEVKITDGVDLVIPKWAVVTAPDAKPGQVIEPDPIDFYNAGNRTTAGFHMLIHLDSGLLPAQYENCVYAAENHGTAMDCTFDTANDTLAPGDPATISGLEVTLAKDVIGNKGIDYFVFPASEDAPPPSLTMHKGTGTKRLTAERGARRSAATADIDNSDNYATFLVRTVNTLDIAALPAQVTGTVGQTVQTKIGIRNNGPGSLDMSRGMHVAATFIVNVPAGVTVVTAPKPIRSTRMTTPRTTRPPSPSPLPAAGRVVARVCRSRARRPVSSAAPGRSCSCSAGWCSWPPAAAGWSW